MSRTALIPIALISATSLSVAAVQVERTPGTLTLSNASTKIVAALAEGRAKGFSVVCSTTNRTLGRIEIGGGGRWTAVCTAAGEEKLGAMVFRAIDTSSTGSTPVFDDRSEIRVELQDSAPHPTVKFRLDISALDPAS